MAFIKYLSKEIKKFEPSDREPGKKYPEFKSNLKIIPKKDFREDTQEWGIWIPAGGITFTFWLNTHNFGGDPYPDNAPHMQVTFESWDDDTAEKLLRDTGLRLVDPGGTINHKFVKEVLESILEVTSPHAQNKKNEDNEKKEEKIETSLESSGGDSRSVRSSEPTIQGQPPKIAREVTTNQQEEIDDDIPF